jgi:hypothetical protein
MEWKRARRDETEIAQRWTWESRCLRYRIQKSLPKYEGLATIFYALNFDTGIGNWLIIGRHRTRKAAEKKCELHQRNQT